MGPWYDTAINAHLNRPVESGLITDLDRAWRSPASPRLDRITLPAALAVIAWMSLAVLVAETKPTERNQAQTVAAADYSSRP